MNRKTSSFFHDFFIVSVTILFIIAVVQAGQWIIAHGEAVDAQNNNIIPPKVCHNETTTDGTLAIKSSESHIETIDYPLASFEEISVSKLINDKYGGTHQLPDSRDLIRDFQQYGDNIFIGLNKSQYDSNPGLVYYYKLEQKLSSISPRNIEFQRTILPQVIAIQNALRGSGDTTFKSMSFSIKNNSNIRIYQDVAKNLDNNEKQDLIINFNITKVELGLNNVRNITKEVCQ